MPHPPEHAPLTDAIIDHQLDAEALIETVTAGAGTVAEKLVTIAKKLVAMRAAGRVSADSAKALLRKARANLLVLEFAQHAPGLQRKLDGEVAREREALKKVDARQVGKVSAQDLQERRTARETKR